jgi:hypothetical protein
MLIFYDTCAVVNEKPDNKVDRNQERKKKEDKECGSSSDTSKQELIEK